MGEEALTCKSCNEPIAAETVFCPGCGEQLREPPKEKPAAAKKGKTGLIVGIVGALVVLGGGGAVAVFALGVFDNPVTPPPPPPVQTGPTAADIKKAVDKRAEVRLAIRDREWDAAEQKLNVARSLHPDHEENDALAGKIRVGRATELYRKQYRPQRHTPDGRPLEVPDCWRAAVSIGGSTVAMIVMGASNATDTVLAAESITAEQKWKKALALEGEGASLRAICISVDNEALVVGGTDGVLRVHAMHDGHEVDRVAHAGTLAELAVTFEDVVALNDDGAVTLYKHNPLRKGETIEPAEDALPVMALDPKHQWVVVGGKAALRVAYFGKRLPDRRLPIEGEQLAALTVSPDGATIAAAIGDGTVLFFETQTGKQIGRGSAGGRISQIAFDPSGRMVMAWWRQTGVLRYLTAPELDVVVEFDTGLSGTTTRLAWAADGGALSAVATKGQASTYAVFRLVGGE